MTSRWQMAAMMVFEQPHVSQRRTSNECTRRIKSAQGCLLERGLPFDLAGRLCLDPCSFGTTLERSA